MFRIKWFRFIFDFFRPSVKVALYEGASGVIGSEISLSTKNELPPGNTVFDVVVIPMEFFCFRIVDIPLINKDVVSGQINHFFPVSASEILWDVFPLKGRSFLIVMDREKYQSIQSAFNKKTREKALFIPAFKAAAINHIWDFNGSGTFAVPAESGYLVSSMLNNQVTGIDYKETDFQQDDVILYDDRNMIMKGAALFRLIPNSVQSNLSKKTFISKIGVRTSMIAVGIIIAVMFFGYSLYDRDVKKLDVLTGQISSMKEETARIEDIIAKNGKIADTTRLLKAINEKYKSPYVILNDVSSRLPDSTFIYDFFIDNAKGYITGVSKDATDVLNILSKRPYISTAEFSSPIIQDNEGNKRFQISFTIVER